MLKMANKHSNNPGLAQHEIMRQTLKEGKQIVTMRSCHKGAITSRRDQEVPEGVPKNYYLKEEAFIEMQRHRVENYEFGEAAYKAFYDDVVANEYDWIDVSYKAGIYHLLYCYKSHHLTCYILCSFLPTHITAYIRLNLPTYYQD